MAVRDHSFKPRPMLGRGTIQTPLIQSTGIGIFRHMQQYRIQLCGVFHGRGPNAEVSGDHIVITVANDLVGTTIPQEDRTKKHTGGLRFSRSTSFVEIAGPRLGRDSNIFKYQVCIERIANQLPGVASRGTDRQ